MCHRRQRGEVKSFIQIQLLDSTSVTQSHHGNCSVFFDVMVTRVWLYGGAGVIEELWATRFIILLGSKSQFTHSIMLVCGGCANRTGSTKQW